MSIIECCVDGMLVSLGVAVVGSIKGNRVTVGAAAFLLAVFMGMLALTVAMQ